MTAASFLYAGTTVRKAPARALDQGAIHAFVVWWYGIGGYMASQAILTALTVFVTPPLWLFTTTFLLGYGAIAAGLWGITYYVVYLWTGREWFRRVSGVLFAGLFLTFSTFMLLHRPEHVVVEHWLVRIGYATPPRGPIYTAILAGYALPPILASIGYLSLWGRTSRRDQRYRIALVGLSIVLFLGTGLVVRLGTNDFLMFVNLALVGLGTAGAVFWAYHPPALVRAWLGSDGPIPRERPMVEFERDRKEEALDERCRELI